MFWTLTVTLFTFISFIFCFSKLSIVSSRWRVVRVASIVALCNSVSACKKNSPAKDIKKFKLESVQLSLFVNVINALLAFWHNNRKLFSNIFHHIKQDDLCNKHVQNKETWNLLSDMIPDFKPKKIKLLFLPTKRFFSPVSPLDYLL